MRKKKLFMSAVVAMALAVTLASGSVYGGDGRREFSGYECTRRDPRGP